MTEGPLVNGMLLPVVPGDVFQYQDSVPQKSEEMAAWKGELEIGQEYFMLLGQLCDLVPRGDTGKARANLAFLVGFKVLAASKHEDEIKVPDQLYSGRLGIMFLGDLALHFDFREVLSANVQALQFCAFNRFGGAFLSPDGQDDTIWSLASVAKSRMNALKRLAKGKHPVDLEFCAIRFKADDSKFRLKASKSTPPVHSYPIRRVCRVRDIEANEALAALERYWQRPAKPHYFAQ